jgi:hypothetical protein
MVSRTRNTAEPEASFCSTGPGSESHRPRHGGSGPLRRASQFRKQNGRMMEGDGGASIEDLNVQDGRRRSIFRAYTFPYMDRPNLTVLTQALVTRVTIEGKKATGVEILYEGKLSRIRAGEPFLRRAWDSRRLASPPFQKQQNTAEVLT